MTAIILTIQGILSPWTLLNILGHGIIQILYQLMTEAMSRYVGNLQ